VFGDEVGILSNPKKRTWQKAFASGTLLGVPRKIRQLVSDLETAGFIRVQGGKGSHRKFRHAKFQGFVLISGHDGDDVQHYQEKQVRNALRRVQS
jgi:predicted RNA binding protein YcfA (HicA-like mRNA interferase family)